MLAIATMNIETNEIHGLEAQVALDLMSYLSKFSNQNFGIRVLSKETGLNEKTIKRLLKEKNKPTYQTLYLLYSEFLNEYEMEILLKRVPSIIAERINHYSPDKKEVKNSRLEELLDTLKKEPVLAELFVLAGMGPLLKSVIGFKYGQYGLKLLDKLCQMELILKVDSDTYVLSKTTPTLDGEAIKFLGEYFSHRFSKPENAHLEGENCLSFYAESLNEEGLQEWLAIDSQAFYKKLEIANNPKFKGNIPSFTYTCTDTIETGKIQ